MKRIFVASPLRGDIARNMRIAEALCLALTREGFASFAPHLFYTLFLSEAEPRDRALGISAGIEWLKAADELWVYAEDFVACSEGMKAEVDIARAQKIPIRFMPPIFQQIRAIWESPAR